MINIMKIMSLIQKEGEALKIGDELKEICIRSIDLELNIGRDRAEQIVFNIFSKGVKLLEEKGII